MNMSMEDPSPLFRIDGCRLDDFATPWPVPALEDLDSSTLILGRDTWQGPDDLHARVQFGWCDDGLLFRFRVRDAEVVSGNDPEILWTRDAVEIFLAPGAGCRFPFSPSLQLVFAAPADDGTVLHKIYWLNPDDMEKAVATAGRRVPGGYELQILLRWGIFGKNAPLAADEPFHLHLTVDDWDTRDAVTGNAQARVMSMNRLSCFFSRPEAWGCFVLTDRPDPKADYNLAGYRHQQPIPRHIHDGRLPLSMPYPVQFSIYDDKRQTCIATLPETRETVFNCPEGVDFLHIVARFRINDELAGHMDYYSRNSSYTGKLLSGLRDSITDVARPDRQIQALGILSCIDFTDCADVQPFPFPDPDHWLDQELLWRQRRLAGEDASGAPGLLRFLNLVGQSEGQVSVAFSRLNKSKATLTVSWGTLPLIYAWLLEFPTDEDAAEYVAGQLAFKREAERLALPDYDEAWMGTGHISISALPWDHDPNHLVAVTCRRNPHAVMRFIPEDALALSPVGYVCYDDAPPAMIAIMEKAGLSRLTPEEAAETTGRVIHLGTGHFDSALPGVAYNHSCYGVEARQILGRIGNCVFTTAANIPENGLEVLEALARNKPVSFADVDRWRRRLLDSLGGDVPACREDGRRLHSGEEHAHSIFSDGSGTPTGLLLEAAVCGMDFLILTDHGVTLGAELLVKAQEATGNRFPVIIGEEITLNRAYHLNLFPLTSRIPQNQPYPKLLKAAREQGAVVVFNHPMTYGINLRHFWYGDFRGTGLDAVERRIEYREKWRKTGTEPVFLGSTDTHYGIFGHMDRTVILGDELDGNHIADAIRQRLAGMLAPDLAEYVVADPRIVNAVRAALADRELPARHARRLADAFATTNIGDFVTIGPKINDREPEYGLGDPNEVIMPME